MVTAATHAAIFEGLDSHLQNQLALCDALEKIADDLPENVDMQECLHIAKSIFPVIKRAHEYEETQLFPILKDSNSEVNAKATLERLHSEHWEDESYAIELQEALTDFAAKSPASNAEALGYMLRGFFGSLRRHIASEEEFFKSNRAQ